MLVSRCHKSYVIIEGQTDHYHVCMQCGLACELIEGTVRFNHDSYVRDENQSAH